MAGQQILERVHIPTGNACNNRCAFCMEHPRRILPMPPDAVLRAQLEKFRGTGTVLFTAGEPLLNRDIAKWARFARDAGFARRCIVTNGRLLADPALCLSLIEAGMNDFTVSIHGPDAATHDTLTGVPGSFEQTLAGLHNLARLGLDHDIEINSSTVLTRINNGAAAGMLRLLAPLRLESITFKPPRIAGRAKRNAAQIIAPLPDVARSLISASKEICRENFAVFPAQLIRIAGVPRCLLHGIEMLAGDDEIPIFADRTEVKAERIESMAARKKYPECRGCVYAPDCEGLEKEYVRRFGRDFIKPRKRPPAYMKGFQSAPPARIRAGAGRLDIPASERKNTTAEIEKRIKKLSDTTRTSKEKQAAEALETGRALLNIGLPGRALGLLRIAARLAPSAPAAAALAVAHMSANDIPSSKNALALAATLRGGAPPLPEEECLSMWFRWHDSFAGK